MNFKAIERRFLVKNFNFIKLEKSLYIKQAYLKIEENYALRIRIVSNASYITLKRMDSGITRQEFEFPISMNVANYLITNYLVGSIINKKRYIVKYDNMMWEIDEFFGDNEGLVIAEIELEHERQEIIKPNWIGQEISTEHKYLNCNLAIAPFNSW